MKSDSVARIRGNRSMSIDSHTIRIVRMRQIRHTKHQYLHICIARKPKSYGSVFAHFHARNQLNSIPARGPLHSKVSCVIRKVCRRNELQWQQQQQRWQQNTLAQSPAPTALSLSLPLPLSVCQRQRHENVFALDYYEIFAIHFK